MFESFVSTMKDYDIGKNPNAQICISDLVSCIQFNSIVDHFIDTKGIADAPLIEKRYEENISDAMSVIEQKFHEFGLDWIRKPTIHASSRSLYIRAQIRIWMKSDLSTSIHVPLYYTYDNWRLLEKENVEHELVTVISNSIVQSLKDLNCMFINPRNFDKFPAYNVEVIDYTYDQWNIVLEVMTDKNDTELKLYYVWDSAAGDYKRKGEDSELALKHNKYSDFIKQMM